MIVAWLENKSNMSDCKFIPAIGRIAGSNVRVYGLMSRGKRIPVVAAIDEVVRIVLNVSWINVLIYRQTIGQRNQRSEERR